MITHTQLIPNKFKVSVIVPVYNAERFVRRAVESVVNLDDVGEVILIEDGSPDNALTVCKDLVRQYPNVRLLIHPSNENRGAGASRNLGLRNATCEYIAFLDADDVFLPNRFRQTRAIFGSQDDIVGVYEAIGVQFYDEQGKDLFCKLRNIEAGAAENYITRLKVSHPEDVYKYLITGRKGFFSTLGVTIRRDALKGGTCFNESLRLHQDTELWIRLSYHFKFVEGSRDPVALRGVHAENRIAKQNLHSKYKYYNALMSYFKKRDVPFLVKMHLYKSIVRNHPERRYVESGSRIAKVIEVTKLALREWRKLPFFA